MTSDMRQLPAGEWVTFIVPEPGTKLGVYGLPIVVEWDKQEAARRTEKKLLKLTEEFRQIAEGGGV